MTSHADKLKAALDHLGAKYALHPSNRACRLITPREQAHADVRRTFDRLHPGWDAPPKPVPALVIVRVGAGKLGL